MAQRGVNKVILIGNTGQDPDVRYMPSGNAVANISLATSEAWKDKNTGQQQERTEWHRVVFFNRLAEIVNEYVRKGSKLYVEGSLRTRSWEQDGITRYATEIVASEMQMLDSKPDAASNQPQQDYRGHTGSNQANPTAHRADPPRAAGFPVRPGCLDRALHLVSTRLEVRMFVVFEGIDGAGKTTVIERVRQYLIENGIEACSTSELGSDHTDHPGLIGARDLFRQARTPEEQYKAVIAARTIHQEHVLQPALDRGQVVLMDRYLMSTLAYQGQHLDREGILDDHEAAQFLVPDITFVLALGVGVAQQRKHGRAENDQMDSQSVEFYERARALFMDHTLVARTSADQMLIDANRPLEDVVHLTRAATLFKWSQRRHLGAA